MEFTWDPRKAASNERKHHVAFEEAATVFGDPLALAIEDQVDPERTLLLGVPDRRRLLLVVHLEVEAEVIRITSAPRDVAREESI